MSRGSVSSGGSRFDARHTPNGGSRNNELEEEINRLTKERDMLRKEIEDSEQQWHNIELIIERYLCTSLDNAHKHTHMGCIKPNPTVHTF